MFNSDVAAAFVDVDEASGGEDAVVAVATAVGAGTELTVASVAEGVTESVSIDLVRD